MLGAMDRGSWRIYVGAAPGVGTTHAMLDEARRRAERGSRVVIGWVDGRGWDNDAAPLAGLERVPTRPGPHGPELDVAAVIARAPEVCLVDDLAGGASPRWQQVGQLLEAGIDVVSTMHIDDVAGLRHELDAILGTAPRPGIPEAVLRHVDQIELVDMTPEALRRRLAHGNVVSADQLDAVTADRFRPEVLAATRRLAMLWVASLTDDPHGPSARAAADALREQVDATRTPDADRPLHPSSSLPRRRRRLGWCAAIVAPPLLAAALVPVRPDVDLSTVLLAFLAVGVMAAAIGGTGPGLVASATGAGLASWYFTQPYGTLTIAEPEHAVALVLSLIVTAATGTFVAEAAHRAAETAQARSEAAGAAALAAANDLRGAILNAASHDLRSPLAGIKAAVSSLLATDVSWDHDTEQDFLTTIDEETDRLTGVLTNLLDLSRLQAGVVRPDAAAVTADELVAAALVSLGLHGDRRVVIEVPEALPDAFVDAGLIERVLANLIQNAMRHATDGPVRVQASVVGDRMLMRVVDRGPGVPRHDRDRVFLAFEQAGDSGDTGVGLGLAVSRGLVHAHQGALTIEDTPGGGCTMVVELPLA